MNESGDMKRIEQVKGMIGKHTRLITCLPAGTTQDATKVVPEALAAGSAFKASPHPATTVAPSAWKNSCTSPLAN